MGSASSSPSKAAAAPSSTSKDGRLRSPPAQGTAAAVSTVEEEEEGEVPEACADCDHCKFMMGGACRDEYVRSRRCSAEAELAGKDPIQVKRYLRAGAALWRCVSAHEAYYRPYIRAVEERCEEEKEARRFDHLASAAEDV